MKKGIKIVLIVCLILAIALGIIIPILPFMLHWNPAYGEPSIDFPIAEPLNITRLSAYNTPNWGQPGKFHNGIDLVIENATMIISPCFGTILNINTNANPYQPGLMMIQVNIKVNLMWTVSLVFEPYSNNTSFNQLQLSLITVKPGQYVTPGTEIGKLLNGGEYPHLHYMVSKFFTNICPYDFSSETAKTIFDEIALRTNSTICYP